MALAKKMNTLIPMEDENGNRSFVNHWDVKARSAQGWKVVGNVDQHVAALRAPVDALTKSPAEKAAEAAAAAAEAKASKAKADEEAAAAAAEAKAAAKKASA